MAYIVDPPIIQNLGMQGEYLHVKVTFPVCLVNVHPIPNLHEQERQIAGTRSVVLKMRAEDLPQVSPCDEAPHFNVGQELRQRFGPGSPSEGDCAK